MSNSKLATSRIPSKWSAERSAMIDRITIHHAAGVNVSAEDIANSFTSQRMASANYCIGVNGDICVSVDEYRRAYTSNNGDNDNRAVTIEVANCKSWPNWEISDSSYKALISLCADICQRHGKNKMVWIDYPEERRNYDPKPFEIGMTLHRDFAATACPGEYLTSKMPEIAMEVTNILECNNKYQTLDDCPPWAYNTIKKLCEKNILQGTGHGLDLSFDMLRLLVILDRAGIFGEG